MNQALLDWYRANVCDDNPASAWHTIHRNGPLALQACRTDEDFAVVARAMEIAAAILSAIQLEGGIPPDMVINPPPGFDVYFNGRNVALWYGRDLIGTAKIIC